jgi:hypothetical protein
MEVPELECQEKMTTAERHKEKWSPRQQLLFDFGQFVLMGMNHHPSIPVSEGAWRNHHFLLNLLNRSGQINVS